MRRWVGQRGGRQKEAVGFEVAGEGVQEGEREQDVDYVVSVC